MPADPYTDRARGTLTDLRKTYANDLRIVYRSFQPIDAFKTLIDEELTKANDRISSGSSRASYYKDWVLGKGLTKLDEP